MGIHRTSSSKLKTPNLKGKRILITAGPTWVSIDRVRVISNIATGRTGIMLAKKCAALGSRVTLLLGPVGDCTMPRSVKLIRFTFFDDLKEKIEQELALGRYDIIIHSAAVADFKPTHVYRGKIDSGRQLCVRLAPLPKIIEGIRNSCPESILVMFKLEPEVSDASLIRRARGAQEKVGADYCVANRLCPYRAFIIDSEGNRVVAKNKYDMVRKLCTILNLN